MIDKPRSLAVVTGASTGIGFDLLVAADEAVIHTAASAFRDMGVLVDAVEADLATIQGVDKLYAAIGDRPVEALPANGGRGLGKGFLDQDFDAVRRVLDTNICDAAFSFSTCSSDAVKRGAGAALCARRFGCIGRLPWSRRRSKWRCYPRRRSAVGA